MHAAQPPAAPASASHTRPDAAQATQATVTFGQDDDITVLTLTRLEAGEEATARFTAPSFEASY